METSITLASVTYSQIRQRVSKDDYEFIIADIESMLVPYNSINFKYAYKGTMLEFYKVRSFKDIEDLKWLGLWYLNMGGEVDGD